MESIEKKTGITDRKLQRFLRLYIAVSAVFIVILAVCVLAKEYAMSFDETSKNLERIRLGLVRIERATRDMQQSIVTVEQVIPLRLFAETPQRQLLAGLDDLKSSMKGSVINISDISTKENKIILPISIKGFITDYSLFVNEVGKLQAMRFPFMTIQSIVIKKEDPVSGQGSGAQKKPQHIVYEITGELTTLSDGSGAAQEKQDNEPVRRRSLREGV